MENIALPEMNELLTYALKGKFFKYGKKQRLLESSYLITDSLEKLNDTNLGKAIQTYNEQPNPDRWFYEVQTLIRLMRADDYAAVYKRLAITLDVAEIMGNGQYPLSDGYINA